MVGRNILSNVILYTAQVILLMWFTRFLLERLGPGVYGLVPLATMVTAYLGLLLISLNGAVGRFLARDMARGDVDAVQTTLNTALWGGAALCAALLPIAGLVAYGIPAVINVPAGQEWPARILFLAVLASFLLVSAANPLSAVAFAQNRLDLQNLVQGAQALVRVAVPAVLIGFFGWGLGGVSLGVVLAGLAGVGGAVALWRRLGPQFSLVKGRYERSRFREMLHMGGWALANQGGGLLFESSDVFIANVLWGAFAGGRYAAVVLFAATLRAVGAVLASPLLPPIVHRYAQREMDLVMEDTIRGQRLLVLAMALPVSLVCGFAPVLLEAWLGPSYRDLWPVVVALTIHLGLNIGMLPLFYVQIAANKLRLPGLVTLATGLVSVMLAVALGRPSSGIGLVGIAIAPLVILTAKNIVFMPAYTGRLLHGRSGRLLLPLLPGLVCQAVLTLICAMLVRIDVVHGWGGLVLWGGLTSLLYALVAVRFVLLPTDRAMLTRFFRQRRMTASDA